LYAQDVGNRMRIQIVALLGILAVFAIAGIRTHTYNPPNVGDVGKALSAVLLIVLAFELFLWRLVRLPGVPPNLRGTWKMELAPVNGQPTASLARKGCYLSISQTASTIKARLLFEDGESRVTTATLGDDHLGKSLLLFYDFDPKEPSDRSPRRKGAAALKIIRGELIGSYWNDVGTWGRLTSDGRTKKLHETYDSAAQGVYSLS
jgi:SMODS-associating 2TM, beta-strand rich effector domain